MSWVQQELVCVFGVVTGAFFYIDAVLVPIRSGQATRALSTARLRMLPCFYLPPINVVVSHGPSGVLRPGRIHLGQGFPLRCFQRFSRPDRATRHCRWHDNRYTSGRSVPVLSY